MAKRYDWLSHLPLVSKLLLAFGLIPLCCMVTCARVFETFPREAKLRADERRQLKLIELSYNAGQALRAMRSNSPRAFPGTLAG